MFAIATGVWLGWPLHGRLDQRPLYRACDGLLVVTAFKLLWDGVSGYLDTITRLTTTFSTASAKSGPVLFEVPPYSPDFNPIEKLFAKLKALLRKAAERTIDALWTTIGCVLDAFTPTECANYFRATGYEPD